MPTKSDFDNLISSSQAGNGACLYEQGWSGYYWSSTDAGDYNYYSLGVGSSSAFVASSYYYTKDPVRCVSS